MTGGPAPPVLALTVAYDGTRFAGWQEQPGPPTVQGTLRDALARLHGVDREAIAVDGAGRTDAGVHALGQVASYRPPTPREPATVLRALAGLLPGAIRVLDAEPRGPSFHARRSATGKLYRYRIVQRDVLLPFEAPWAWHVVRPLDAARMERAARALVGRHDFAAFAASGRPTRTTVRTVTRLAVRRAPGGLLLVDVEADGFLYKMVRNIAGLLVDVGRSRRAVEDVPAVLASRDRARGSATAPARGLCLVRVRYGCPAASVS